MALNSSQAIVNAFMQNEGLIPVQVLPIDFRPRLWYNPDLKSTYFMLPGLDWPGPAVFGPHDHGHGHCAGEGKG